MSDNGEKIRESEKNGDREAAGRKIVSGLALVVLVLVLLGGMLYLYWNFPNSIIGPRQPVPFSHRIHAGVKAIDCRFCHPHAERGTRAGIPSLEKCMFCHEQVIPMNPWLVAEREHYANKIPIVWDRVFYVPDYVKFRHQPHVKWAAINCDHCHGPVQTLDRLKTRHFKMGFCLSCHRSHHAITDCYLTCHH